MLYKEIVEAESCDLCPLQEEKICPGGWSSDGRGEPVEPPCCDFDDDTDVTQWVKDYWIRIDRMEQAEVEMLCHKKVKNKPPM